jgi:DNA-directed RNA polymerase I subunit RPA2
VFTEIRTTSVRKLTPESWGFLCPVHTPDGSLCGLLNHLAFMCEICTDEPNTDRLVELLKTLGMIPLQSGIFKFKTDQKKTSSSSTYYYEVLLNGKLLGYVDSNDIRNLTEKLRYLKALATLPLEEQQKNENFQLIQGLSKYLEICHVPKIDLENCSYTLYPGLYIFTSPGRMMRPVKNLNTQKTEYIGTMEQCYLHVCIKSEEYVENVNNFYFFFTKIGKRNRLFNLKFAALLFHISLPILSIITTFYLNFS